jgi:hypothetical protein
MVRPKMDFGRRFQDLYKLRERLKNQLPPESMRAKDTPDVQEFWRLSGV